MYYRGQQGAHASVLFEDGDTLVRRWEGPSHAAWARSSDIQLRPPPFCFLCFTPQSCSYDHVVLRFYLNGELLPCEFSSIKGAVYPCIYGMLPNRGWSKRVWHKRCSLLNTLHTRHTCFFLPHPHPALFFFFCTLSLVDDGAIIDAEFETFDHPPPHGYSAIMFEKDVL